MANEYRLFRSRYAGLFRDIGRQHPAFWTELGNLVEGHVRRQYTTEGAQVREFPATREYGVQTERTWSVDQVLNEVFGREPIEITEASTQTPSKTMKTTGMHTLPVLQRTAETQTSPDHWAKGTVTLLPNQKTVGTQVEITTWDLGPMLLERGETGQPRGRGRGLRPVPPSELRPVGIAGIATPRETTPLPREAPPHRYRGDDQPLKTLTLDAHSPGRPRDGADLPFTAPSGSPGSPRRHRRSPGGANRGASTERRVSRRSSRSVAPTRVSTLCWNCRATDHRYSDCPHPRDNPYCYGCGRRGVTMKSCPGCGTEWRNLGPYRREQGHLGNRDLPFK
ncbi:inner centromere [Lasius niger]|uniref:Inner centromere n=1 Tax=Lasius niger TaxID=67767 RepID=A0A0J7K2H8_LASNI|nr:inner centromere [Lasius niger]